MNVEQKLRHEIKAATLATLYFGDAWIAALIVLTTLVLAEYRIAFHGWSLALVGALVLAKRAHTGHLRWARGFALSPHGWTSFCARLCSFGVAVDLDAGKGF
jgi:hypothetical protein